MDVVATTAALVPPNMANLFIALISAAQLISMWSDVAERMQRDGAAGNAGYGTGTGARPTGYGTGTSGYGTQHSGYGTGYNGYDTGPSGYGTGPSGYGTGYNGYDTAPTGYDGYATAPGGYSHRGYVYGRHAQQQQQQKPSGSLQIVGPSYGRRLGVAAKVSPRHDASAAASRRGSEATAAGRLDGRLDRGRWVPIVERRRRQAYFADRRP